MWTEIMKMQKKDIAEIIEKIKKKEEDNSDVDYYNNDERYYI